MRFSRLTGFLLFFLCLLVLTLPISGDAQENVGSISADDYWTLVAETLVQTGELNDLPIHQQTTRLQPLVDLWGGFTHIVLDGGTPIAVNHVFLIERLQADPPKLEEVRAALLALINARDRWPTGVAAPEKLASLEEILGREAFNYRSAPPDPISEFLQTMWNRVLRWVAGLLPEGGVQINGGLLNSLFIVFGVLTLIGIFAFIAFRTYGNLVAEAEKTPETGEDGLPLTADKALKRANQLSRSGDARSAVRFLYLSALLLLEERGVLRYDRSKTNLEYLTHLEQTPQLRGKLQKVVEVFDRVWYGYQEIDPKTFDSYSGEVTDLRREP